MANNFVGKCVSCSSAYRAIELQCANELANLGANLPPNTIPGVALANLNLKLPDGFDRIRHRRNSIHFIQSKATANVI